MLQVDDSEDFNIEVVNRGSGTLEWQVEGRLRGDAAIDPWTLRESIHAGEITGDSRIEGVIFAEDHYYVTGANRNDLENGPDLIYIFNREGNLVDSLLQPEGIGGNYGIRDLAWDGELIWGTGSNMVGAFNLEGELVTSFAGPYEPNFNIAYDTQQSVLYVASITHNICVMDRQGNGLDTLDRKNLRIYGLAYWQDDPDGFPLYIFSDPPDGSQRVYKMNPGTGDTMFVAALDETVSGACGGAFITRELDNDSWVFIDIANDADNDRVDVWQLAGITHWMEFEPDAGMINATDSDEINLTLDATGLEHRLYQGQLLFQHNAAGGEISLPIDLTVIEHAVDGIETNIPDRFGISNVYPNPFNASITITYGLDLSLIHI